MGETGIVCLVAVEGRRREGVLLIGRRSWWMESETVFGLRPGVIAGDALRKATSLWFGEETSGTRGLDDMCLSSAKFNWLTSLIVD